MSDGAPEVGHEGLHSLTLVLSSARSGSTLLCRDIASLGGLGSPREYLKGFDAQARQGSVSASDVLDRLAKGCLDETPGVAAVKLMVPQAGITYRALAGRRAASPTAAMSGVVTWAREHFDRVLLVFLVRNVLDQAISRVYSTETGIFQSTDARFREAGGVLPEIEGINQRILAQLGGVLRNRGILHEVLAEHSDIGLLLTYDELTRQVEKTTSKLVDHARAQGFQPHRDVVTRKLTKVISAERSSSVRDSFLEYLKSESGAAAGFSIAGDLSSV